MIIFIVWFSNFHAEDEFSAAFSSREKAEEMIAKFDKHDQRSFRIEEYELDG
ncbi:hypothetical protein phiOC_p375 [Ochrobactrum phage vB_OspM_OC]|nr:hypothetical protein phiOC_p375 [Ochrobactrum phage vB_OspM_OC]